MKLRFACISFGCCQEYTVKSSLHFNYETNGLTHLSDYFAYLAAQTYFVPLGDGHLTVCFKTLNFHLLLLPLILRFNTIP